MRRSTTSVSAIRFSVLLTIALGFAACSDTPTGPRSAPQQSSPIPRANVSDGANGGNAGFYFLPPLVKQPTFSGVTDPDQSPTVVVCALAAASSSTCQTITAQFSLGSGTGAQTVRYDETSQQYIVNWPTDQCLSGSCTLDQSKTYRIRVLVGALELGHADVVLVTNGSQVKNAQTNEVTALVNGRMLPVKFRIEKGATAVLSVGEVASVGTNGGAITSSDGMIALRIPPGAVSLPTPITLAPATDPAPGAGAWTQPVDLGPTGTTFNMPVTLTLGVDPAKLPRGVPMSALRIYTQLDGGWAEVPGSVVNEIDDQVSAPISHFSTYTVGISPNTVTGSPSNTTLVVGQSATLNAWVWQYYTSFGTYCYWDRIWYTTGSSFGRTYGYWYYYQTCYNVTQTNTYPSSNQAVYWGSSASEVLQFSTPLSFTNANGGATSPPASALRPGQSVVSAYSGDATASIGYTVIAQPAIDPFPQAGWQLVVTTTPGTPITTDVPIRNAGSGTLHNMRIAPPIYDCYSGEQVAWVTATFTEGVIPVIMHLTLAPPATYPVGTHDYCYTLLADGAPARSYGVRLVLNAPVASNGPLYVTNHSGFAVTAYAPTANGDAAPIINIEGSRTALSHPSGIGFDATGNLYVSSYGDFGSNIVAFAPGANGDATPIRIIGGGNTGLAGPQQVLFDGSGRLFVPNYFAHNVLIFAPGANGDVTPTAVIGGSDTRLSGPNAAAFDASGRLYIANAEGHSITIYAAGASGNVSPVATLAGANTGIQAPSGVAFDAAGRLYVTNYNWNSISVFAPGATGDATPLYTIGGPSTMLAQPVGIVFDASGRLWVSNFTNSDVIVFAVGAVGDARPVIHISGGSTGINHPSRIVFGPP